MRELLVVVLLLATSIESAGSESQRPFERGMKFSAVDSRHRIDYRLGPDLVVRAHRQVDAHGTHMGWWLEAVDRRLVDSPNFLYECLYGHGPHPTDLLAGHLVNPDAVAHIGPLAERILPVWGYPYDLRVRCAGCGAQGDGTAAHFVRGTIEVSWRRLAQSNAQQKRLSDLRR